MKKLALKLDDLRVDTFHASSPEPSSRGTVQAQEDTFFWPCQTGTCKSCDLNCLNEPVGNQI